MMMIVMMMMVMMMMMMSGEGCGRLLSYSGLIQADHDDNDVEDFSLTFIDKKNVVVVVVVVLMNSLND